MSERKQPEKNKLLPELRSSVTEILVANGRAFQPFIRTFRYTGENVTKQNLGTLIGVFEIDDQSEDSAYIVNFLASVAKKEYFNNPRRGAIESFEAALHKINLALAELVKHGNVTWLGKFHGALGILEKNNLHFSVSGHANILLLRNGTIADISEGLASDESHIHPIKTFVEVSSGRLSTDDQVLLTSPELLALFSLEDLNKHATRMGSERFTQFLRTALVNELDMTGLMVVDVTESIMTEEERPERKKESAPPAPVNNVFSQSAFTAKKDSAPSSIKEVLVAKQMEKEEEYIDSKTGHIYVQGDTPELQSEHPFFEAFEQNLKENPRHFSSFSAALGKRFRKTRKQTVLMLGTVGETLHVLGRKLGRGIRRSLRKYEEAKQARAEAQVAAALEEKRIAEEAAHETEKQKGTDSETPIITVSDIPHPKPIAPPLLKEETLSETALPSVPEEPSSLSEEDSFALPSFMKEKLAQFYQNKPGETLQTPTEPTSTSVKAMVLREKLEGYTTKIRAWGTHSFTLLSRMFHQFLSTFAKLTTKTALAGRLRPLTTNINRFFRAFPLKRTHLILGGIALLVLAIGAWYFFRSSTPPTPETVSGNQLETTPIQSPQTSQATGEITTALSSLPDPLITSVILNDQAYAITGKNIVTIADHQVFPFPGGSRAKFAAAMDDLRLIFIYTESGKLYAWSPIAKTFVENALPFDGSIQVAGIATYLTYLYVLDSQSDQVYRFPRADGGFGTATPWLREAVAVETTSKLAVNETLFIAPDTTTVKGFFRGRAASTLKASGDLFVTDLYTHPGLENVYVLDSEHKRIIIWNQDGRLIKELPNDKLAEGLTLSVNEKSGEFFIGTQNSLLSYKLK